ncbi:MAG: hypothetical protein MK066_12215 [Crocinitomicaceae bacterium]|nr:hypothetical protein [Crocinitomicaceae bacterium]
MNYLLIYPIPPAIGFGVLNWLYWRKQGYTSIAQLFIGILIFYAIFYSTFKLFK